MPALNKAIVVPDTPFDWLDCIMSIQWDTKNDVIRWSKRRVTPSFPLIATPLTALESTHKHLRQILRVTFASRQNSEDRAILLRSWRSFVNADFNAPVIFAFTPRLNMGTVFQGTWSSDLVYAGTSTGPRGEKLIDLRWGLTAACRKEFPLSIMEANFPGFAAAHALAETLGLSPMQAAEYFKSTLWAPKDPVCALLPEMVAAR